MGKGKEEVNEKEKSVYFNKGGDGGITPKVNLNMEWLSDMGVNKENKRVVLTYNKDNKEIRIRRKSE